MGVGSGSDEDQTLDGQRVAGRYRIENRLARGGVGTVYQVVDESTGNRLALKRLLTSAMDSEKVRMLFQREFHTLTELKHPRIIQVFDYGVDGGQPFYTMELLDGQDLGELAPLPYRKACSLLRDVASSLALLHTRHLLHRDLSPRNVRITGDGRCKLLDFGTMASFGVPDEIVGTPPLVPPESLRGMPLDQRADLYSLGALAYRILTRSYAYRARRLEDLPQLWQTPPVAPRVLVPEIPEELDALIMSLISLDPVLRPGSATEVIDRLTAIGELDPDPDTVETAQGYLLRSRMIGRKRHAERIRRRIDRTVAGKGGCILIEGNPGVGKTRLLDEASLHAHLLGGLPLRVDASASRQPYSVARAMVRALVHAAPQHAREATEPFETILGPYFPELVGERSDGRMSAPGRRERVAVQTALLDLFIAVSRERPLVMLVDDLHRVDEGSAAMLATLATQARDHRIMLVTTRRLAGRVSAPQAMGTISGLSRRIRLHRLRRQDTGALIQSLFGEVENSLSLAAWIHGITTGTPTQIMALSQHLVDAGVVRYADGMWVLPTEVSTDELPLSVAAAMSARAAALGQDARRLAENISVRRGTVPLGLCVAVAEEDNPQDVFPLLDELGARGVLVASGEGYSFSQEALRDTLLGELDPARLHELHRRHGEALLNMQTGRTEDRIDAGFHILRSGDESRGADILAEGAGGLAVRAEATSAALPALEAALEVYERQGRSPAQCLRLRASIVGSMDRRTAVRYGDDTLRKLARYAGLERARKLQPYMGGWLATWFGLLLTRLQWSLTPSPRRGPKPRSAIRHMIPCIYSMLTVHSAVMNQRALRAMEEYTQLLQHTSKVGAITHHLIRGVARVLGGQTAIMRQELQQAEDTLRANPTLVGLGPTARLGILGGILISRGVSEAQVAVHSSSTDMVVDKLRQLSEEATIGREGGLTTAEVESAANQTRMLYHLMRGERESAEQYREHYRLHGIKAGLQWQYDLWRTLLDCTASARSYDMTALRRAAEQLDQFVHESPDLEPFSRLIKGYLAHNRRQYGEALQHLGPLTELPIHSWAAAFQARTALAEVLIDDGRPQGALETVEQALTHCDPDNNIHYVLLHAVACRALAHMERHEEAAERLAKIMTLLEGSDHPMLWGLAHEVGAQAAWLARRRDEFDEHVDKMLDWYGSTRNPALLMRAQRISELARSVETPSIHPPAELVEAVTRITTHSGAESVEKLLADCQDTAERDRRALHLLIQRSAGTAGHLYLWARNRLRLAASEEAGEPQYELEHQIQKRIAGLLDSDAALDEGMVNEALLPSVVSVSDEEADQGSSYTTLLLTTGPKEAPEVVGVVALQSGSERLRPVKNAYLRAIADVLARDRISG